MLTLCTDESGTSSITPANVLSAALLPPSVSRRFVSVDAVELTRELRHGERFGATVARIAPRLGARKLGTLRFGNEEFPLRAGDVVGCPAGGIEVAHQIINTGKENLLYYVIANNAPADFYHFPDSNKWGFSLENVGTFRIREVDYYDGEE